MGHKIEKTSPPRSRKTPQKALEALPLKVQTQSRQANACPRVLRPFPPPVVRYSYDIEPKSLLPQSTRRSPLKARGSKPVKRKRDAEEQEAPTKRRRPSPQLSPPRETSVNASVYQWLRTIPSTQHSLASEVAPTPSDTWEMPPKNDGKDSKKSVSGTSISKSDESSAVKDANYRQSLGLRNIDINKRERPFQLEYQANRIVYRSRGSPELDDLTIRDIKGMESELETAHEEEVKEQLGSRLFPAIKKIPDTNLKVVGNQRWGNGVPIPLDSLQNPPPLPFPKPDYTFGYSERAFTKKQYDTLGLFVTDPFGQSYSKPLKDLSFPYLSIEFKSQATGGTPFIANNQNAGSGAMGMQGHLEVAKRTTGLEDFDFDAPQYFSVSIDQRNADVNVHWVSKPEQSGAFGFHMARLKTHCLSEPEGLRAIHKAVKNILDYNAGTRLRELCEALDRYRDTKEKEKKQGEVEKAAIEEAASERAASERALPPYPSPAAEASSAAAPPKGRSAGKGTSRPPKQQVKDKKEVKGTRGSKRNANDMT